MKTNKRFNIKNELEKLYIEVPKALLYEPKYKPNKETGSKGLSNDAKILYGILLDRTYLSLHTATEGQDSKYVDENGDIFIYFDNASIEEILNVATKKAIAVKKELVEFNLLEEVQQGQGKSNRLYLNVVETNKSNLSLYTSDFKKIVDNKKELENARTSKYKKKKAETIGNTLDCQKDSPRTVKKEVQGLSKRQLSNTESSNTDFSNPESFVVVINGKEIKIDDDFRKIQLNESKTPDEKIKELNNITYMNEHTMALMYRFIKYNILVSEKQIKMLSECVYDVANKSLDYTVAKNGQTFSYFWEVYSAKEKEDMSDLLNDFTFKPSYCLNN